MVASLMFPTCGLSLKGKDAVSFLEKLVIADVAGLAPGFPISIDIVKG